MNKIIGIIQQTDVPLHSTSWNQPWVNYCKKNKVDYRIIDPLNASLIDDIKEVDILLWHLNGFDFKEMLFAKSVIKTAEEIGVKVFPSSNSSWFFDDKLSEFFILKAIDAPIPDTKVFFEEEYAKNWINEMQFTPLVAKLRNGSGSSNVILLNSKCHALKYIKKMFGKGISSYPSLFYKAKSNIKSAKSKEIFWSRFRRIPEFLRNLREAKRFPKEKGYVLLQKMIPNDGFDLKVVTVGDKVSFFGRYIRKNDFRASGGGDIIFDRSLIPDNVIQTALLTSEKLGVECMGYDFVVDKDSGIGKIIEMSFGFSHELLYNCKGHFNKVGEWIPEPLNAPEEIIINLCNG